MNNKFLFLVFLSFFNFFTYANSQEQVNSASTDLENESSLPIFEEDKANFVNNDSTQPVSIFNISDLLKIVLFLLIAFFIFFLLKKLIFYSKKSKYEQNSNLIKELVFYEIDVKNSIRIINILDNVYIFLVSSNSFTLLKEIKSEEELEDLKLRLSKINDSAKKDSFQSIFKKMLLKKEEIPSSGNDYVKLEEKIEASLKDKQDRLKKF
ncbi:flagella biosynthesis regulatory protein FliZ [Borreliella burgdorferi]|uniref:Flagellar protein FliZ n=1 Tax=Borreliella burgdorferi (strain ATCC 35210 / DSM 4680 / CIP 102532 / B31) TaxID=224326 RepID=FLIZ_BORBU|nr:flagella biosynthesis regulatory protein FliZ [Borreliella burgdorferi]Q44904.2 RecName: Full=Flagellar protein FliZ [Borreliella burgdorferi B31]AGS66295.1 flagellar biosynthesis protein FliZ [Borreliella burgdorferi CA382]AAA85600.1 FliZ [Borreliella burgdorferi]AAC66672.1 flagellar protein FliZ [Borreliella burgdorferi B31]ARS30049.1 flagellar protein FliZ [Borreliella burgdorferi]ARS31280.1 flagellar protein FliZ [Borreliella burgdorferi]